MAQLYKLIITVPETDANIVREAIGKANAGTIGNYTFCSFSTKGIGRFLPGTNAQPAIGSIGHLETVIEEKIETICDDIHLKQVIAELKRVHPYEEPAFEVIELVDISKL